MIKAIAKEDYDYRFKDTYGTWKKGQMYHVEKEHGAYLILDHNGKACPVLAEKFHKIFDPYLVVVQCVKDYPMQHQTFRKGEVYRTIMELNDGGYIIAWPDDHATAEDIKSEMDQLQMEIAYPTLSRYFRVLTIPINTSNTN